MNVLLLLLATTISATAAEYKGAITSAALFKNGLAVITREFDLPGPGDHTVATLPDMIHGTFWVESHMPVTVHTVKQMVAAPPGTRAPASLQETLVGRPVRLFFRVPDKTPVTGVLLRAPGFTYHHLQADGVSSPTDPQPMYVLQLPDGRHQYVAQDLVGGIESVEALPDSATAPRQVEVDQFIVHVPDNAAGPLRVRMRYLARGLSWAPAYQLNLTDEGALTIAQSAVLRNELVDLDNVAVELISGFPSVEFEHVTSPLAAGATWSQFFTSLTQGLGQRSHVTLQQITSNAAVPMLPHDTLDGGGAAAGDGSDLHYQPIGQHSLPEGAAMSTIVASAEAAFEPVIEWHVPDNPGGQGNSPGSMESQQTEMWDAIRFKNPFDFPMTTGPAMVMEADRFLGSRTTRWANPGDDTLAYVSKTLSVLASASEVETSRTETTHLRRSYWKSTLEGTLTLRSLRGQATAMIIHKQLDGALLTADHNPQQTVGTAGPGNLNPSTHLTWDLTLEPGEERTITYRYEFLSP